MWVSGRSSTGFEPHKQLPGHLSMKDREWFTNSGGACLVKFIWRSWSPWCGGGERMFLQLVKHLWNNSLPLPVLLNLSTCMTEPKLLTQRTLSNSIPHGRWLCVSNCVYVLQRKCALYTSRSSISSLFGRWKKNVEVLLKFWFCVVHYEPWVNFKGPLTCILRVFTDYC